MTKHEPFRVMVLKCHRCNGNHFVRFRPFKRQPPPDVKTYTHWAKCPNSGEPILSRIRPEDVEAQQSAAEKD